MSYTHHTLVVRFEPSFYCGIHQAFVGAGLHAISANSPSTSQACDSWWGLPNCRCCVLQVRKDLWGYAPDENLSCDDMLKVKYQGIRPAPGYPSQPDHTEKNAMWALMNVKDEIECELTESLAMLPAASVSGVLPRRTCIQTLPLLPAL
jgi:Vitamin B12 dependent methionine synthase, activation domain